MQSMKLLCGNASRQLARDVADYLGIEVGKA